MYFGAGVGAGDLDSRDNDRRGTERVHCSSLPGRGQLARCSECCWDTGHGVVICESDDIETTGGGGGHYGLWRQGAI
jgi:hypothetical protein